MLGLDFGLGFRVRVSVNRVEFKLRLGLGSEPAWLALRPDLLGLRPACLTLGPSREKVGQADGRTYRRTDNLPILQDFVPYWIRVLLTI